MLCIGTLALAAACGSRTGLLVPVVEDAGVADTSADVLDTGADVLDATHPDVIEEQQPDVVEEEADAGPDVVAEADAIEEDVVPFPDAATGCPDGGATLVYLITQQNVLMSFYPPTAEFRTIGTIACPDPTTNQPFSMAVSRSGVAYVVFNSGFLYRVSTSTAACETTPFLGGTNGIPLQFGMGFAADSADAGTDGGETLYIALDPGWADNMPTASTLATIDTTTFDVTTLAMFQPTLLEPELTGTATGNLYGFWAPSQSAQAAIVQIDKTTAQVAQVAPLPGVTLGGGWAFAYWGGDFYVFTAPGGNGTQSVVTRYRPSDGTVVQVAQAPGVTIVGAGVSTCAPGG